MPGPFAAYPGHSAKLLLGPAGAQSENQLIAVPATRWFFPQRLNSRAIYSSSGGLLPDVLPANLQTFDIIISGRVRSDYSPFAVFPMKVGAQVTAAFDPNFNKSDPVATVPALCILLDIQALAGGQVEYVIGLRAQWQNNTSNFSG